MAKKEVKANYVIKFTFIPQGTISQDLEINAAIVGNGSFQPGMKFNTEYVIPGGVPRSKTSFVLEVWLTPKVGTSNYNVRSHLINISDYFNPNIPRTIDIFLVSDDDATTTPYALRKIVIDSLYPFDKKK